MKRHTLIMALLLVSIVFFPSAEAKLSSGFVACLADKILLDCEGEKLIIPKDIMNELGFDGQGQRDIPHLMEVINKIEEKHGTKPHITRLLSENHSFIRCGDKKLQLHSDGYYWDDVPVWNFCPKKVNIRVIIFSLISFVKNTKGGQIFVISLISIGVIFSIVFFRIKIWLFFKKSYLFIFQKILHIKTKETSEGTENR